MFLAWHVGFAQSAAPMPATKNGFVVISHRGNHVVVPENTLEAVQEAIRVGADYTEMDLRTTKDSCLVLSHDRTVDRMTDGKGLVSDLTLEEIKKLTVKGGVAGAVYRVPEFKDILRACKGRINIYLDFKDADPAVAYRQIQAAGMEKQVVVYLNKPGDYAKWKAAAPAMPLMASVPRDAKTPDGLRAFLDRVSLAVVDNISDTALLAVARERGVSVWLDVEGPGENPGLWAAVLAKGVQGMQTDHPEALDQYLRQNHWRNGVPAGSFPAATAPAAASASAAPGGPGVPAAPAAPGVFRKLPDLAYGPAGRDQSLDSYVPEEMGNAKVVVFIHGSGGNKDEISDGLVKELVSRRGYLVVSMNYRLGHEMDDIKAVLAFVADYADQYHYDGKEFALMASGAGARLASSFASQYDTLKRIKTVVDLSGPADLARVVAQLDKDFPSKHVGMPVGLDVKAVATGGPVVSTRAVSKKVLLPNGWTLTPAGRTLPLGDLPLNIAVSTKNYLAVTNNGESTQTIQLINVGAEEVVDSLVLPKSWLGLKFSGDGKFLYASGGNDNWILKYAVDYEAAASRDGRHALSFADTIPLGNKWPEKISPAGLDIDDKRQLLYVVTRENNSLYIVDLASKKIVQQIGLGGEGYTCVLSRDRKELYISCWGCDKLLVFDTGRRVFSGEIAVGDNPNDLCLTKNGKWLFVANANDNSVAVIDVARRKVVETLNAALYPDAPPGSTSNALALSTDDKTLYVANADNNCLAVFDVREPGSARSMGFIPVGWYPTAVRVVGKKIWVANGKGLTSLANPYGPSPVARRQEVNYQQGDQGGSQPLQYIGGLFKGAMSIIDEPDDHLLEKYTAQVYQNTPYTKKGELVAAGDAGNPIPMKVGNPSPIKYVFYVIKENRTYDQVLGDVPQGNGDTSLCLFGEHVTPNQHALAGEFVLLDNFYVDAEVSSDGHNWSMGAYATDYLEKTWPTGYGRRGGSYDGEGNRAVANNKGGFIWDHCSRAGVSFRTYGEFADHYRPSLKVLEGHYCPDYAGGDLTITDTARLRRWRSDFDSLLAAGAVPHFNTVRFPNDHTEGVRRGRPTPFAHVADNDLAVGKFIEYLSNSPIWKETAVFILEDDAQNGPDHVDAHRSPAYVAGGFVKRHFVDHTIYSTSSMLRTMELILGIPPMSQYDAAAMPMWNCFSATPDVSPFRALPENIDLTEKTMAGNEMVKKSDGLDFADVDGVPDALFNEILWKGIKGMDALVPSPRRAAFVKSTKNNTTL